MIASTVLPAHAMSEAHPKLDVASAYRLHAAFIGRVIQRRVGDGPHVDDLLQETFIVAFRRRAEFDGRCAVRTWLYSIASHLCLRHQRSLRRFSMFQGRFLSAQTDTFSSETDHEVERRQALSALFRLLDKLPQEQREVFVLYELEQLQGSEIAALVGVPIGTVWTRLHKAREKFTRLLRQQLAREKMS